MADRVDIVKDLATQRLYFYPQEGRPDSTPTVELVDRYGSTLLAAASTYVTLDAVSTTIKAGETPAVGDESLVLTSATGLEVHDPEAAGPSMYEIVRAEDSKRERVRVTRIDATNTTVYFDEPLENLFAAGDTFHGYRFYYTFQAAQVNTLRELCRARALYTVNSLNYATDINYDVVLIPLLNPLTYAALKDRRPDLAAQEPAETRGTDFATWRRVAWDEVRQGIREKALDGGRGRPALVRVPENLADWGWAVFDRIAHDNGIRVLRGDWDASAAMEELRERVMIAKSASMSKLSYDKGEDDSVGDEEIAVRAFNFTR